MMLNEKVYTCSGKEALDYFKEDPEMFDVYHTGYQQQISNWPELPVNSIINWLLSRSSSLVVADFGYGDARIAQSVKNKVFSFDLVSKNPSVIACDMSNTSLESSSIDVTVLCLSLMGTNYSSYITEAHRVLRPSGWLLIAEVKSRFDPNNGGADPKDFVKEVVVRSQFSGEHPSHGVWFHDRKGGRGFDGHVHSTMLTKLMSDVR